MILAESIVTKRTTYLDHDHLSSHFKQLGGTSSPEPLFRPASLRIVDGST